jgi:Protein of unknown function with HXXEE motif
MRRQHEFTLWVVVMVMGLHFLEEFALDLRTWMEMVLQVPVTWEQAHLINAVVTLTAIAGAAIGWRSPALSLAMPAVLIVNALGFHLAFSIIWGAYSPGTMSALVLFVPAGVWAFIGAHRDGVLTRGAALGAVAIAVVIHLAMLSFHLAGPPQAGAESRSHRTSFRSSTNIA